MQKRVVFFFIFLCSAAIFIAGCTNSSAPGASPATTPTPQIVYVTVLVTPTTEETPEIQTLPPTTEPTVSHEIALDETFLDYVDGNGIFEAMTALGTSTPGVYSQNSGYNAVPRKEAIRLTELMSDAPVPGSATMKTYRSAMMDALAEMDGSTAGFTRYRDDMQTVILARNAALAEMHSRGSSSVDTVYFKGRGNDERSFNVTEPELKLFTLHHTGDRNFAVTLTDENGKYISLLANELGDYSGKKTERLAIGKYFLKITADGEWTIGVTSG